MFLFALLAKKYKIFRIIPIFFILALLLYISAIYYVGYSSNINANIQLMGYSPIKGYTHNLTVNYSFDNFSNFNIYFVGQHMKFGKDYEFSKSYNKNSTKEFEEVMLEDGKITNYSCTNYFNKLTKEQKKGRVIVNLKKYYITFPLAFDITI